MDSVQGDAYALPFRDGQFDAVISECAVCNLDKHRAVQEMQRVARPGGVVGIHDLCWRPDTPEDLKQSLKKLEGEEPETGAGWKTLFEETGLVAVVLRDRSDLIPSWMRETRTRIGVLGYVRIALRVLRKWGLTGLRRILASERISAAPTSAMPWSSAENPRLPEHPPEVEFEC